MKEMNSKSPGTKVTGLKKAPGEPKLHPKAKSKGEEAAMEEVPHVPPELDALPLLASNFNQADHNAREDTLLAVFAERSLTYSG